MINMKKKINKSTNINLLKLYTQPYVFFKSNYNPIIPLKIFQTVSYLVNMDILQLIREELKLTFPNIGEALGGKDHSTVMHAWNKIKKELLSNYTLEQDITLIKNKIYNEENPENS